MSSPDTPQPPNPRLQTLETMLQRNPSDAFLLYAIAMEHKKARNAPEAIRFFDRVLQVDPGYCVAYHQAALTHDDAGDRAAAIRTFREGVAAARRKGDRHAADEMQAALDLIER